MVWWHGGMIVVLYMDGVTCGLGLGIKLNAVSRQYYYYHIFPRNLGPALQLPYYTSW